MSIFSPMYDDERDQLTLAKLEMEKLDFAMGIFAKPLTPAFALHGPLKGML